MPLLSTLGTLSARGIGFFDGSQSIVTTLNFTSNAVWTAPAGVTSIVTLVGKGQDGISDYTDLLFMGLSTRQSISVISGSNFDYSLISNYANNLVSYFNGVSTITPYSFFQNTEWLVYPPTNSYEIRQYNPPLNFNPITVYIAPGGGAYFDQGSLPSSGAYSGLYFGSIILNTYNYGRAGSATTAFGFTFAGGTYSSGTGTPAIPATYSSISVTPGQNYTLVVPSGGSVQIVYALPI